MSHELSTRVLAIRHGQTDWNAVGRMQGHTDTALNAEGRRQAARMAEALADEAIDVIYTSDLARALDTAAALAERTGARLVVDRELRERGFGRFEGVTFEELERDWPDDAARWRSRDPDYAPGDGERLDHFYARCVAVASRLAMAHAGGAIALVSHGGVLDSLYRLATRAGLQTPRSWRIGNASISRLLHTAQGFTLVGWNDERHLDPSA